MSKVHFTLIILSTHIWRKWLYTYKVPRGIQEFLFNSNCLGVQSGNSPLPLHACEVTYLPTVSLFIHARKGQSSLEMYFTLNLKDTNSDSRLC